MKLNKLYLNIQVLLGYKKTLDLVEVHDKERNHLQNKEVDLF